MAGTTPVIKYAVEPAGAGRAGTLWLVQAVSGLLLVFLLLLHMVAHHFVVEGGLRNFQDVIAYVSNPLIFSIEILFLLVVTTHAVLGLRAIVLDFSPGKGSLRTADILLTIFGIAAASYGIWLAVSIQGL